MILSSLKEVVEKNKNAFYVFDTDCAKERIKHIRNSLPKNVEICYAIKANTFIVKELVDCVDRFEICSPGEYEICDKLNVPVSKMVISGVYKTPDFIENLVSTLNNDYILTVESLTQFEQFKRLSEEHKKTIKILLRLTNGSQFGINEEDIERIVATRTQNQYIEIIGIQYFSGTQKTSVKKIKRELEKLDSFLYDLYQKYNFKSLELEYGTGFPISYFHGEELNEDVIFSEFSQLVSEMKFKAKIVIELGRSIAASCGRYYTHIVDIKRNKDQNYAIIDGGMHQLSYYGQYMAMKQPFLSVYGKESQDKTQSWNICGSLCSMNDIVSKQTELSDIEIGDIICFENTGAYSVTEGISLFLSRDIPAVYLTDGKNGYRCVREPYESNLLNTPIY